MLEIKNNGRYFIKDAELLPEQNDEFHHEDISKNIINIIENETAPFNIAVVGKWGLGKSSLIKFVTRHFEPSKSNYVITEINAWKYEKEALRRAFLRQVLIKLNFQDKNTVQKFLDNIINHTGEVTKEKMTFLDYINEWKPIIGLAIVIYAIGIIFSLIGEWVLSKFNSAPFSMGSWVSFVLGPFVSIYIPLFAILVRQYIKASKSKFDFKITPPTTTTDEYESKLKEVLKNDNRKIITVIDDLDRLTPTKIVEALDAIKAFVNYDNCIFLVPFDDSILKKALKEKTINLSNNEHLAIESDLFLDKLFQYKLFLPSMVLSNLPDYAVKLAQKEIPDIRELCGKELFDRICKEILIHRGVTTPRQVKKILNAFSNNVLIAFRRENGYLEKETLTNESGLKILAKISVLQSDYCGFYNSLFSATTLIEEFIALSENNESQEFTELLKPYFDYNEDYKSYKINKVSEGLLNFLKRTSNIKCIDISHYLYLSKDRNSILFGDELSRSIRDSVTSGATELVKAKIKENSAKDLPKLLHDILMNAEPYEYDKCVISLINVYDDLKDYECKELLNLIGDRASSIINTDTEMEHEKIHFNNLFSVYLLSNDRSGLSELITRNLHKESKNYQDKLELFFANESKFPVNAQVSVQNYITSSLGETTHMNFDDFFNISSLNLDRYFLPYLNSNVLLKKIANYVNENELYDESDVSRSTLITLFNLHIEHRNINKSIESIFDYFDNDRFYSLFADELENNVEMIETVTGTLVATRLFEIENEEISPKINKLLSKMQWNINTQSEAEAADNYLLRNYEDKPMDDILNKMALADEIKYIPNTVAKINSTIIENSIEYTTIEKMQQKYNDDQRVEMFNTIINAVSYTQSPDNNTYGIVEKLLSVLSKYPSNTTYINKLGTQIYTQISKYPTNEYSIKSLNLISAMIDVITNDISKNFISWASNASNISSYPVAAISILDIFREGIEETDYLIVATNLMNNCIVDTLPKALRVLRKLKTAFKSGITQLTTYKEFLLKYVTEEQYRKQILNDINKGFGQIGDVSSYIINVLKYHDTEDEVINTSIKFLKKTTKPDEELIKVLNEINETEISALQKIYDIMYEQNSLKIINELALQANEELSVNYLYNLLCLMLLNDADYKDSVISSLLVNLFKVGDITIVIKALERFSNKKIFRDTTAKRKIGDALYTLFRGTTDRESKTQLFGYAKQMKLENAFRKNGKNKKDFTEVEEQLMKSVAS